MAKRRITELNIEIDELTNSIKEVASGEVLRTEVIRMLSIHAGQIKRRQWQFNWYKDLVEPGREVYKLVTREAPGDIQGLICLEDLEDHVFVHLLESSKANKGKNKRFTGIPGNLMAYACQLSLDNGYLGFVSFVSKHAFIEHYRTTLGAQVLRENRMVLDTMAARALVERYFKDR